MDLKFQPGDILIFQRYGMLANMLSIPLKYLISPGWDRWGWHMAIVGWWNNDQQDWRIIEATGGGVRTTFLYSYHPLSVRVYRWFDQPPSVNSAQTFYNERDAGAYDAIGYVWTILSELAGKYTKGRLRIPRIWNDRYYCWELVEEFCGLNGKPWSSTFGPGHRYPLLTNFLDCHPTLIGQIQLKETE